MRAHTDAEAVFGMIYAQAEDDFSRIEANYLTALGRTAEAEGERTLIWQDLRARLYVSDSRPARRATSSAARPGPDAALMDAWADGLNYFLATHSAVQPRVLDPIFEPWMVLSFTEGSIGGDIERISLAELARPSTASRPRPIAPWPSPPTRPGDARREPHAVQRHLPSRRPTR